MVLILDSPMLKDVPLQYIQNILYEEKFFCGRGYGYEIQGPMVYYYADGFETFDEARQHRQDVGGMAVQLQIGREAKDGLDKLPAEGV